MPSPSPRRPWLAVLLNLVFPGLGHLYAGDPDGAALWFAAPLVSLGLTAVAVLGLSATVLSVLLFWGIPLTCYVLLGISGWRAARRAPVPFLPKSLNRWYWYLGFAALSGNLFGVFVRPYLRDHLIQAFRIPSESMVPTLVVGDLIVVDRRPIAPTELHPGDLVVFQSTEEPGLQVLKRVMGVEGDTLQMWGGAFIRNWVRQQDDPFYDPAASTPMDAAQLALVRAWQILSFARPVPPNYTPDPSNWGPIIVPPGHFFALGDNRNHSWDSRYYGFVPDSNLLGRPRLIYWNSSFLLPGMLARVGTEPK